jgi:hypothetical protein
MLLLASTSDLLRVVTSSTSATDVQVSAMDMNTTTSDRPTGYRANTAISTATTTTIAASPAANTLRTIKTVSIFNRGGSTQVVTVLHTDGTTVVEIAQATLAPDTCLQYHEAGGWFVKDTQGRDVVVNLTNAGSPITDSDTIVRLTADVVNNNATANTIADVTGLSFPMLANKLYQFEFHIVYDAAATTTGSRWSLAWGGVATTKVNYTSEYSLTTTTTTRNALLQAADAPSGSNATSAATTNNYAFIYGVIQPNADATLIARFASEIANSAITAKVNSFVRYRQITP